MLEAKQKAAAETEEQKRQKQQSALAKYRQAFASDTEVCGLHMIDRWYFTVSSSLTLANL